MGHGVSLFGFTARGKHQFAPSRLTLQGPCSSPVGYGAGAALVADSTLKLGKLWTKTSRPQCSCH